MHTNSIRDNLTKDNIISDIKLTLSADFKKEKTFIIVEGQDDTKFFRSKISANTEIKESFSGKVGVDEIVDSLNDDRVIGIKDRDFDKLSDSNRIFYYDFSCMEIMLIFNDDTFKSLTGEFYTGTERFDVLRYYIARELLILTCIRKVCAEAGVGINFKGLSLDNCDKKARLHKPSIFAELKKINNINKFWQSLLIINRAIGLYRQMKLDNMFVEMTQGHDFLKYFCIVCNRTLQRHCNVDIVSSALRCAFQDKDFIITRLYSDVKIYESNNNLKFLCM